MEQFNGKTVLVTGGSSGNPAQKQLGPPTLTVTSEAGDLAQIDALMALIKQHFGDTPIFNRSSLPDYIVQASKRETTHESPMQRLAHPKKSPSRPCFSPPMMLLTALTKIS